MTNVPIASEARVVVYGTGICPYCVRAKGLLIKLGIPFDEVRIDLDPSCRREFLQLTNGARTVPQILIDGRCIGGFSELNVLHGEGMLEILRS